jgi:putative GTP pyrophosphokinase
MLTNAEVDALLDAFEDQRHDFRTFMDGVRAFIGEHPALNETDNPIVHSYKSRLKDRNHLAGKIRRKEAQGRGINIDTLFWEITDLAGVRILHLFQQDFSYIDALIRKKVEGGDWILGERPRAYSWDPETVEFFRGFDLEVTQKPSSYTSVHYLIRPRIDSPLCCEVQVRTLFEEIWGEVDHRMNYPTPTDILACKEQLKVLSKIVGGGSRLLDSIQRVASEKPAERAASVALHDEIEHAVVENIAVAGVTFGNAGRSGVKVGQRVFHTKFGYGHVAEVEGNKLEIDFEHAGRKRVLDSFVSLA